MSNSVRTIDELLALEQGCRTCPAQRGEWCRIRADYKGAGDPAQFLHVERTRATYHARWVGYTAGQLDVLDQLIYHLENLPPMTDAALVDSANGEIRRRRDQAERWAQSAHQRALEDIPEGWHR